jgi:hypothetical protein
VPSEVFEVVVTAVVVAATLAIFTLLMGGVLTGVNALSSTYSRVETMVAAVSDGRGHWYMVVVWTGVPRPVRYVVLSNGEAVPISSARLLQCGVGYAPAPYRYCLYELTSQYEPIGVITQ